MRERGVYGWADLMERAGAKRSRRTTVFFCVRFPCVAVSHSQMLKCHSVLDFN
jgi:hypothetical protein